jgi:hypothetical protein
MLRRDDANHKFLIARPKGTGLPSVTRRSRRGRSVWGGKDDRAGQLLVGEQPREFGTLCACGSVY